MLDNWSRRPMLDSWLYIYKLIFILYCMILIYLLFRSFFYYHKVCGCILILWPSGRTNRCYCYLLVANNWPNSIIMYCSVGCLCYLGGIYLLYEGLLLKLRSVRTSYPTSMPYSSKAEVGPFVRCVLCVKCRWRPLQTDG